MEIKGGNVMVAAKSSRVNRQYKKKYRIRNWRGVRAWPQEPRRRHDLAERGCNCRVEVERFVKLCKSLYPSRGMEL